MKFLLTVLGRLRLLVLFWSISIIWSTSLSQSKDPDPQCTTDRKGLPACNFNSRNCFAEPKGVQPAWRHVKDVDQGPVAPYEKGYVYLDPKITQGEPRKMIGHISAGKKAVCVKFFYATKGNTSAPITFYIQNGLVYSPVHRVQANTGGSWLENNFSCCLPERNKEKKIAIEATSTDDAIAAIDYVDVRTSDMTCKDEKLVCYPALDDKTPPKLPGEQTTKNAKDPNPRCTSARSGLPACNFNSRNCFAEQKGVQPAWRHVKNGDQGPVDPYEKGYIYLDPKITQGVPRKITGQISAGKKAVCVKFFYATKGNTSAPITFYIQNGLVYSPVHRVQANTGGSWLENNFSCCLPERNKDKLLAIEATSTDDAIVAVDYVDVRTSDMTCKDEKLVCYPTLDNQSPPKPPGQQTTAKPPEKQTTVKPLEKQATVNPQKVKGPRKPKKRLVQSPDPRCTRDRSGLPACNFNSRNCFAEPKGVQPAWRHVKDADQGPVVPYEKGYVFLDPKITRGEPRKMIGHISAGKKAVCVKFFYATKGNTSAPITFYIQNGLVYSPVHRVEANTGGKWMEKNFSCCLPDLKKDKLLAIEATSTDDGIAAIDYVDVRTSDMTCKDENLVCYPTLEDQTPPKLPEGQTTVKPPEDNVSLKPKKEDRTVHLQEDKTSVEPIEQQTTVKPPEVQTTIKTPEEQTTVKQPEEQTTVEPPEEHTSVKPPDEQTTVAPPEVETTVKPKKEQTTVGSREQHTSVKPPKGETTVEPPKGQTTVASPEEHTSVKPPGEQTTIKTPEEQTTMKSPDEQTTMKAPEEQTTVKTPEEHTSVKSPEEQSTVELREHTTVMSSEEQTTIEPPEEETTVKAPKDQTTSEPPKEVTTVKPPKEQTTSEPPKEVTTVKPPKDQTTSEPPEEKTTVNPPKDQTTSELPEEETTVKPPEKQTTVKPSEQQTSMKAPEEQTTVKTPEEHTSVKSPEEQSTVELREYTTVKPTEEQTTIEPPEEETTVNPPKDQTTSELPEKETTVKPLKDQKTSEPPEEKTTVKPPKDQTTSELPEEETTVKQTKEQTTSEPSKEETTVKTSQVHTIVEPLKEQTTMKPPEQQTTVKLPEIQTTVKPPEEQTTVKLSKGKTSVEPQQFLASGKSNK
ncbi:hypothetical protein RRG08_027800 [Elysia crispata]|uniref:MAM domain-containing protein n=1 Tax=Elysia crispata TaxID=231223 RepID=A0AAE0YW68_9GAST|nr:hypothetical protein RRG08_027800 [Elysia crispata]